MEAWRTIVSFETYSVSDQGRVRNDNTGKLLRLSSSHNSGHVKVGLMRDGIQYSRSVAKTVGIHFVPLPTQNYFRTPIHLDGDLSNCKASNILWRPKSFAMKYHRQMQGRRYRLPPFHDTQTGEFFEDVWELLQRDGLLFSDLSKAIANQTYTFPTMRCYAFGPPTKFR